MDVYKLFKIESSEHIESAERALMRLVDREGSIVEHIGELFRVVHSIKGSAAYLQKDAILKLSHAFESVLHLFRESEGRGPNEEQTDTFFQCLACLKALLDSPSGVQEIDISPHLESLACIVESFGTSEAVAMGPEDSKEGQAFCTCVEQQLLAINSFVASAGSDPRLKSLPVAMLLRSGQTLTQAASYTGHPLIEAEGLELSRWVESLTGVALTDANLKSLDAIVKRLDREVNILRSKAKVETKSRKPVLNSSMAPGEFDTAGPGKVADRSSELIRVERIHLEALMNLIGELIVTRNSFEHLFGEFDGLNPNQASALKALRKNHRNLHQISERMQDRVMKMQLIPAEEVFQKFPKLVRSLARQLDKQVEIVMSGLDTRIDRSIAGLLGDPLLHLIRNALDHGIESGDQRLQTAKNPRARIELKAYQEHQDIIIEVADDGRGIDTEAIRARALSQGTLSAEEAKNLSTEDINKLIFDPGFSTSTKLSEVSGRGVGLDVVRRNVEKVKGRVLVTSRFGQGTSIRIVVPLTLSLMHSILVRVDEQIYAIPLSSVREVLHARESEIHQVGSSLALNLRGELLGFRNLAGLLGLPTQAAKFVTGLVIDTVDGRLCIGVDSICRKEEIVVKPLSEETSQSSAIMGASLLGDGSAILILDPSGLIRLANAHSAQG